MGSDDGGKCVPRLRGADRRSPTEGRDSFSIQAGRSAEFKGHDAEC